MRQVAIVLVLALGCHQQPLQKHARQPKATDDIGCGAGPAAGGLLWDPAFPQGTNGESDTEPAQRAQPNGGGPTTDRKCEQLGALTIRARTAAANDDCATLSKIDAEVCSIDPAFLANVFVVKVDGAHCRRNGDAIRRCANGSDAQP